MFQLNVNFQFVIRLVPGGTDVDDWFLVVIVVRGSRIFVEKNFRLNGFEGCQEF